jgi:superfamily II DNA or RNA helicase
MIFSLVEITRLFPEELVEQGRLFLETGAVTSVDVRRGGELITAVVDQGGGRPLRLYIRLSVQDESLRVHGECSCDADGPCEHMVAVLLRALGPKTSERSSEFDKPGADTRRHSPQPGGQPAQCLLYLFHLNQNRLLVECWVAKRLTQGGHELVSRFDPVRAMGSTPARFLNPVDLEMLSTLAGASSDPHTSLAVLHGAGSAVLFEKMIATGRCYFESFEACGPLMLAAQRPLELFWHVDSFGRQRPAWQTSPPASHLLPLSALWCLERENAHCAPLSSDIPVELLWELLALPALPPDQTEAWFSTFQESHPQFPIRKPHCFARRTLSAVPLPCLRFTCEQSSVGKQSSDSRHYACLTFEYEGNQVAPSAPSTRLSEGVLVEIERDHEAEAEALALLNGFGLETWLDDENGGRCFVPATRFPQTVVQAWIDFQLQALPRLREQGWRIEYHGFHHRLLETQHWRCHTKRLERQDWFALSLDVEVEGRRVELLPLLLKLLESLPQQRQELERFVGRHLLLPMEDVDGSAGLLRLSGERAVHILELLLDICGGTPKAPDQPIEINRAQLARLASFDVASSLSQAPIQWSDEESRQLAQRLKRLEQIPHCAAPVSLSANLRPYQQQGLEWLQFLREFRLAGILADDMGLGKTLQTLAHLLLEKESGRADRPSLVVVPTSLTFNWMHEARQFTPELKVLLLHGPKRKSRFKHLRNHDLVVTTYPLLVRDADALKSQSFHLLILDEAQMVKNPKSQASRMVRHLQARHRLCLTGTPLENHLGELWSLFDFLMPGLLGNEKQFRRDFRTPIEIQNNEAAGVRLSQRVRPYLLRRTKEQVAKELPEKCEIIQSVALEGAQRELYETVRLSMHRRVREEIERQGLARSQILVLDALMKLRQVCCDPRLLNSEQIDTSAQSAKLDHLMALLEEMVEEGRRILLFSQFTTMLALIEEAVGRAGIDYLKLTGQSRDRERVVKGFQQGEAPLFLISLKAGGVGLNLTAADTVIHYDPWWNPAVERQATDRSHRIGQKQRVFVYKLICEGTLEEKILAMQQRKQRLADGLYQKDGGDPQWNEEDIDALFGPIEDSEIMHQCT